MGYVKCLNGDFFFFFFIIMRAVLLDVLCIFIRVIYIWKVKPPGMIKFLYAILDIVFKIIN